MDNSLQAVCITEIQEQATLIVSRRDQNTVVGCGDVRVVRN